MKMFTSMSCLRLLSGILLLGLSMFTLAGQDPAVPNSLTLVAGEDDVLTNHVLAADTHYILMGFSTTPVVLDITSTLTPRVLLGESLGEEVPFGVYLTLQNDATLYAAGDEAITEIDFLTTL